ncbi:hypothetical protein LTR08_000519 [Meristemomyces frigidus]|nr:hypothetical protein LTR08_000519 [Meristemomyces frigidus]
MLKQDTTTTTPNALSPRLHSKHRAAAPRAPAPSRWKLAWPTTLRGFSRRKGEKTVQEGVGEAAGEGVFELKDFGGVGGGYGPRCAEGGALGVCAAVQVGEGGDGDADGDDEGEGPAVEKGKFGSAVVGDASGDVPAPHSALAAGPSSRAPAQQKSVVREDAVALAPLPIDAAIEPWKQRFPRKRLEKKFPSIYSYNGDLSRGPLPLSMTAAQASEIRRLRCLSLAGPEGYGRGKMGEYALSSRLGKATVARPIPDAAIISRYDAYAARRAQPSYSGKGKEAVGVSTMGVSPTTRVAPRPLLGPSSKGSMDSSAGASMGSRRPDTPMDVWSTAATSLEMEGGEGKGLECGSNAAENGGEVDEEEEGEEGEEAFWW